LKQVSAPFIPHPDGKHIIASRASSEILLVDVRSGEFHQRHPIQEKQRGGAAVAKDGSVAVVGGNVWDLKGNRLRGTLQRTGHELENVAVTPDGRYAVAYFRDAKTSRSYELLLWDLVRMKPTKIIKRFTSRSLPPVLTPSAAIMVRMKRTGSHQDHFINFAHPTSHGILEKRIGYFPQPVGQIHVSSDEQSLGFVSRSGHVITIWDLHKDREVAQLNGHQDRIGGIDVTMNRQMAVSGAWDGILNAWDLPSGRIKWTSKSLSNSVRDVRIMPGERYLASYGGAAVEIWDIESGKRMAGFTCEGSLHTLYTVPKSHYLLTQDQGGRIYVLAFLP
jgi:WD40 repeat protein